MVEIFFGGLSGVVVGAVGRECNEVNTHVDSSRVI